MLNGQISQSRSRAGTNLKVGGGGHVRRKAREKLFVVPSTFWLYKFCTIVLVSAFVMVSTVWSVFCLLFVHLRCPLMPSHL